MAIQQVKPAEAHKLLSVGYQYIDVRTEPEFAGGHPTTAVNIPVVFPHPVTGRMVMNPDFLTVVETRFPKDTRIIVGCQLGGRSQRAADLLAEAGYGNVANMQGGFGGARDETGRTVVPGWGESGLPICTDCGAENSYAGLLSKTR